MDSVAAMTTAIVGRPLKRTPKVMATARPVLNATEPMPFAIWRSRPVSTFAAIADPITTISAPPRPMTNRMKKTSGNACVSETRPPKTMRAPASVYALRVPSCTITLAATIDPTTWASVMAFVITAVREAENPRLVTYMSPQFHATAKSM